MNWAVLLLSFGSVSCSVEPCCTDILIDSSNHSSEVHNAQGSRLGFYRQLGQFGSRPAYKQEGGNYFLYYQESHKEWITSSYYFGSTDGALNNDVPGYCVENNNNWVYHNGSGLARAGDTSSTCAVVEDTCCKDILLSSTSASLYPEYSSLCLGRYSAVGVMNGRYLYQKRGMDRYLEYHKNNQWIITTGVGKAPGYFHHQGGTVCVENAKDKWMFGSLNEDNKWVWTSDSQLDITCMEVKETVASVREKDDQHVGEDSNRFNAGYLAVIVVLITLICGMFIYFSRRLHRSWSKGVQGTQLIKDTFDTA